MARILETQFKRQFKAKLRDMFPGCMLLPLDPNDTQGIPDLLMLWQDQWAAFETKRATGAARRPNQGYYIDLMDAMSFAAFVQPENEDQVLDEVQRAFGARRNTRVSERQQLSLGKLRQREAH